MLKWYKLEFWNQITNQYIQKHANNQTIENSQIYERLAHLIVTQKIILLNHLLMNLQLKLKKFKHVSRW